MPTIYSKFLALIFSLLIVVEVLYRFVPSVGRAGVVIWVISSVVLLEFAIHTFWDFLSLAFDKKTFFTLFVLLCLVGVVFIHMLDVKSISAETVGELSCVLNQSPEKTLDWAFGRTCLYGYPVRLFYTTAIPTLILGRSMFAMHLGQSFYFLVGMVIFTAGLSKYLEGKKDHDLVAATILSFIFHIYYFNHFIFVYEHSIFPFCLALILVGLFFFFQKTRKTEYLFISGIVLIYTIFAYTPALTIFFLSVIVFVYYLFTLPSNKQRFISALLIGMLLLSFALSLSIRHDLNFTEAGRPITQVYNDLSHTLSHIFIQPEGTPVVSGYLVFIVIGTIVLGLLFAFGWQAFIVSLWMLGVIIAGGISKGYSFYGIDFRAHRATVIFPVLFAVIAYVVAHTNLTFIKKKRVVYFAIFMLFFTSGFLFQQKFLSTRTGSRNAALIIWLTEKMPKDFSSRTNEFYFDTHVPIYPIDSYSDFTIYSSYFLPNSRVDVSDKSCTVLVTQKVNEPETKILIMPLDINNTDCYKNFANRLTYVRLFTFRDDSPINIYTVSH